MRVKFIKQTGSLNWHNFFTKLTIGFQQAQFLIIMMQEIFYPEKFGLF